MKLGKAQTVGRQFVQMRRVNFTAVATDIRPTHVIHQDHEDVGSVLRVSSKLLSGVGSLSKGLLGAQPVTSDQKKYRKETE